MKIKGNTYNFGRCVKIAFAKNTIVGDEVVPNAESYFTIIHAPDFDPNLYCAMDVTVTDRPSASDKDNPGFQGTVTIYNPTRKMIDVIADGATWVSDYVNDELKNLERATAIKRFYASRLTCTVSAGYLNNNGVPEWNVILKGFVNGSSLARKGVEDVLTFGVFDINMMQESLVVDNELQKVSGGAYDAYRIIEAEEKGKFAETWFDTLVKYIQEWELQRIPTPTSAPNVKRQWAYETASPAQKKGFPTRKDISRITEAEKPLIPVSNFDRKRTDWFTIRFVKSLSAWRSTVDTFGYDWDNLAIDPQLEIDLKTQIMPKNGGVYADNLEGMLDGLCARACRRVGWYKDKKNRTRNTYVIYLLGSEPLWVSGKKADIKIWNYQNLLESPSVSGSGIMTVKMVFNPQCECGLRLALMLKPTLEVADGTVRDLTMSGELGSLGTSADLATYGTVQLGQTNAVASVNKKAEVAKTNGYMFNIGFPIMSVKHELSTHKGTWTTTVQTVPVTAGLNYKQTKTIKKATRVIPE